MLRHDNADLRLTELGRAGRPGRRRALGAIRVAARGDRPSAQTGSARPRIDGDTLFQSLRRPETTWADLLSLDPGLSEAGLPTDVIEQVTIEAKYDGYIGRQTRTDRALSPPGGQADPGRLRLPRHPPASRRGPREIRARPPALARPGRPDQRDQPVRHRHLACPPQTATSQVGAVTRWQDDSASPSPRGSGAMGRSTPEWR